LPAAQELPAVYQRHRQVQEDQALRRPAEEAVQGLGAVAGGVHGVAGQPQEQRQRRAGGGIVFDEQDAAHEGFLRAGSAGGRCPG
jgi:hypothetical protein